MAGDEVLWVPGLDHAGIATQSVVEKKIFREQGLTRHDLGRDAFLEHVWEWRGQYGGRILGQLRRLGASLDWSRQVLTLDEPCSRAVVEAFVRLHDAGAVFCGRRMVQWCPQLRTAISDMEVDWVDLDGPTTLRIPAAGAEGFREAEFGVIHTFLYPLAPVGTTADSARSREDWLAWIEAGGGATRGGASEGSAGGAGGAHGGLEAVAVSTTRLETMLGDAAVCVHPDDPRMQGYVGRLVVHPVHGTLLPVLPDAELVDMELACGC